MSKTINGLYAITPDETDTQRLLGMVKAALTGGARIVQYRNKQAAIDLQHEQASALLALCRQHHVPLIINDDLELCLALDADGVHLGTSDGSIALARQRLDSTKLIGASCYNRLDLAHEAGAQGADYVAFGSCFASSTKPEAVSAALDVFAKAQTQLDLPTVAIGGITTENAALAINAGADAIAVISALWDADDIAQTATTFSNFFK